MAQQSANFLLFVSFEVAHEGQNYPQFSEFYANFSCKNSYNFLCRQLFEQQSASKCAQKTMNCGIKKLNFSGRYTSFLPQNADKIFLFIVK